MKARRVAPEPQQVRWKVEVIVTDKPHVGESYFTSSEILENTINSNLPAGLTITKYTATLADHDIALPRGV